MTAIGEIRKILKSNFIFYLTGLAVLLEIKYFYSRAGCEDLIWILKPTAAWAGILSGFSFEWDARAGYVNHTLRFIIAPSCSGVSFMSITFAMLFFSSLHHRRTRLGKCCQLPASLAISWLFTILVNGIRIVLSMILPPFLSGLLSYGGWLTERKLHTVIGTVVYFTALFLLHFAATCLSNKSAAASLSGRGREKASRIRFQNLQKAMPPTFWYLSVTLGIPFLNRAYKKDCGDFLDYAAILALVCLTVIALYCLLSFLRSQISRRKRGKTLAVNSNGQ